MRRSGFQLQGEREDACQVFVLCVLAPIFTGPAFEQLAAGALAVTLRFRRGGGALPPSKPARPDPLRRETVELLEITTVVYCIVKGQKYAFFDQAARSSTNTAGAISATSTPITKRSGTTVMRPWSPTIIINTT